MKLIASAIVFGLLFVVVQDVQAFDPKRGNALWGKYAIQTCRSCHEEMGLTSLDPGERSAKKWEALFADNYKELRAMSHDFSAVGINDRQLENIHRYLVDTAKKSKSSTARRTAAASASSMTGGKTTTVSTSGKTATMNSGGDKFDMAAGSASKGRYIFRKCLSCHKKNNAPIVSPGDRTKKAWDRYFAKDFRKFKKAMPKFDTYKYSTSQMEHLHQFFLKYALDAAQPKTCE